MEKIVVKVCCGTMCYVMGGAELQLLDEHLSEDIASRVELRAVTCLDMCNKDGAKAPYAMVGDTIIRNADISKVTDEILNQLSK